jgi:AcrR family transcriptional regulator
MIDTKEKDMRCRIVATAERLFRQIGFQKTTVADIARELRMSSANVYRFFGAKSEINEAVARQLMGEVESAAAAIIAGPGTAAERLRALLHTVNTMNGERYVDNRKMHEMVEVALNESWPVVDEHIAYMGGLLAKLIGNGVAAGEFSPCDPTLTAGLVHKATISFCHPRLMVECADEPTPSLDDMVDFCLKALRN